MLNIKRNRQQGKETASRKENLQYYYRVAALWYEAKYQAIKLLDWKQLWAEAKEEGEIECFLIAPGVRNEHQDPYSDNEYEKRGYTPREYDMDAYYTWQHQRLMELYALGVGDITMIDKTNPNMKQLQSIHRKLRKYIVDQLDCLLLEPEHQPLLAELNCQVDTDEIELFNELKEINNLPSEDKTYLADLEVKIAHALSELLITLNKKRMNERSDSKYQSDQPHYSSNLFGAPEVEGVETIPLAHAETLMARQYNDSFDKIATVVESQNNDLLVTVASPVKNIKERAKERKLRMYAEAKAWYETNGLRDGEIAGIQVQDCSNPKNKLSRADNNFNIYEKEIPF
jgi:hypothetical protein